MRYHAFRRPRRLAAALGVAFVALACGAGAEVACAQSLALPTAGVQTVPGIQQQGEFTTAPVVLDGATLFRVAVPAGTAANPAALATRVNGVQTTLAQVLATVESSGGGQVTVYEPRTLRVHIVHSGLVDGLEVVDARHTDPLPVVTVTVADAGYNATTVDALATEWQSVLQSALLHALELRQPATQQHGLRTVVLVGSILVIASVLLVALRALFVRRRDALARVLRERSSAAIADPSAAANLRGDEGRQRRRFLAITLRSVKPEQRFVLYRALSESIVWLLVLGWFVAVTLAFSLFPQTTPLAQQLARGAFGVTTTIIVFGLVNRVLDAVIARSATAWSTSRFLSTEDNARQLLRVPTISRALSGFKTFLLVFLAVLGVLSQTGVPIGSVVTIGGLAAIALSLAAQNLVRDCMNGLLVLLEDQYVVGDYVTINGSSGLVEHLTLRMVQIRDLSGDLITIPHSSVTSVSNQSRSWSRVDFRVPVDPASDVAHALELVRAAIEDLAREEPWRSAVLEPIEWIGIDALSRDWAIVRAIVRTAPLRQFALRHEINARVRDRFAEANIALGAQIPAVY